jgi:hypothetical protein
MLRRYDIEDLTCPQQTARGLRNFAS